MPSWTLQFAFYVLKVFYHDNSMLRIKLKICLFQAILKIHFGKFFLNFA
jgi:hypothetical protein